MLIENLNSILFGSTRNCVVPKRQEKTKTIQPDVIAKTDSKTTKPLKYQNDLEALKNEYGDLPTTGLCIDLQELLRICPRDRRRIDAYSGLVSYLEKEEGIKLKITSRKTK